MSLTLADRVAAYLDGHTTLNLATTGPAGLSCIPRFPPV